MAESAPELIEQLSESPGGATWRARQADGTEVLATRILLPDGATRDAALDRLRRLAGLSSEHLIPVLGWWTDAESAWYVTAPERGIGLPDLQIGSFLSPQQSAAISFGLLEGLRALHGEGLSHGALIPESVRVLADGSVRLDGHQLAMLRFPGPGDLGTEVRSAGRIVCQAFGITPEKDPRSAPRAIEHAAPALVVSARAIAAGNHGTDIASAIRSLRDTSGPLGGQERLALGTNELAALVTTRRTGTVPGEAVIFKSLPAPIRPTAAPPVDPPAGPAAAAAAAPIAGVTTPGVAQRRSWEDRHPRALPHEYEHDERKRSPWAILGVVALVLLVGIPGGIFVAGALRGTHPAGAATPGPTTQPPPTTTASPTAGPLPSFAPPAAGAFKKVEAKTTTSCAPGAPCTIEVILTFTPTGASHDVTWSFKTFDACTSQTTDLAGGTITAQGDWNTTDGFTPVILPQAKGQLAVVALSGPDKAASAPLLLGTPAC